MNNRFKFRYWHTKENKYIHTQCDCLALHWSCFVSVWCAQRDNGTYSTRLGEIYNGFELIPEQCTGLSDKNGNLIYESDYVKANDVIYRVFWDKTKISLVNILNGDIIDISETITMEIVGNEHEKDNISEIPKNPKRSSD